MRASLLVNTNDLELLLQCVVHIVGSVLPGERRDGAESLVLAEHGGRLPPPFAHVVFYGVELGHCPAVRLSWSALNHVAAILWPPQGWMAAHHGRKTNTQAIYQLREHFSAYHIFASGASQYGALL